jgi:hypothetical protein
VNVEDIYIVSIAMSTGTKEKDKYFSNTGEKETRIIFMVTTRKEIVANVNIASFLPLLFLIHIDSPRGSS